MKKSYIVALIFIGVVLVGMIAYYFINKYGPGSDNAQVKKRVEYILESYGAKNHNSSTWSNFKPLETDLDAGYDAIYLCKTLRKETYDDEEIARKSILQGVVFDIEKVEKKDLNIIVTVEMTCVDKSTGTCCFVFERANGMWQLDPGYVMQALYVGNGIGGSGSIVGDILDYISAL